MHIRLPDDAMTAVGRASTVEWWTGTKWNAHADECSGPGPDCPYTSMRLRCDAFYVGFVAERDAIDARHDPQQLAAFRTLTETFTLAMAIATESLFNRE